MSTKQFFSLLPYIALTIALLFNAVIYAPELNVKGDPNDNIFQFTLVNRADKVWNTYGCPWNPFCLLRLFDHWVPEWAEGYPLPYYYSHLPQITIITSHKLVSWAISLFDFYHLILYVLLTLFPVSMLVATKKLRFSPIAQTLAVLLASHLSTDGLYGMDNSSYLWRGWGLSSQLYATVFMPLAFAFTVSALQKATVKNFDARNLNNKNQITNRKRSSIIKRARTWFQQRSDLFWAVIFTVATLSGHFGLGYILLLSYSPLPFLTLKKGEILERIKVLIRIVGISIGLLSYWFIPYLAGGNFNAISFWDPVWKFNSFGYEDIIAKFFKGEILDFGRFPWLTILSVVGFFALLLHEHNGHKFTEDTHQNNPGQPLTENIISHLYPIGNIAWLYPFWMILFFGRTTLGTLIDLLPGATGFHLHRFINGVHLITLFLIPLGAAWIILQIQKAVSFLIEISIPYMKNITPTDSKILQKSAQMILPVCIMVVIIIPVYQQTVNYAKPSGEWLKNANEKYKKDETAYRQLESKLNELPRGRIFSGRPGFWGKDMKVGDTYLYMALAVSGFDTTLFLPETWSPNSDLEQFHVDNKESHFSLYNFRYIITPSKDKAPSFASFINQYGNLYLYEAKTGGYFDIGKTDLAIAINRTNYINIMHQWLTSPAVDHKFFPVLTFKKSELSGYPNGITMVDNATYQQGDGQEFSIFAKSPFYIAPDYATPSATFRNEQTIAGQEYKTQVTVANSCTSCFVVMKVTYHPNWNIYVDGKKVEKKIVAPFFIGIPVTPGDHFIEAKYEPSGIKMILLLGAILAILTWIFREPLKPWIRKWI